MKPTLSPLVHNIVDYAVVALLAVAPWVFNLSSISATMCWTAAILIGTLTFLTDAPLGALPFFPRLLHEAAELAISVAMIFSGLIFLGGRSYVIGGLLVGVAAVMVTVSLLTDHREPGAAHEPARPSRDWAPWPQGPGAEVPA